MSRTHEMCRVSVKNRAVLWVRSIFSCSLCSEVMAVPALRTHANRLAVDDQTGAGDNHALAERQSVLDDHGIADDIAEADPAHAGDLDLAVALDGERRVLGPARLGLDDGGQRHRR